MMPGMSAASVDDISRHTYFISTDAQSFDFFDMPMFTSSFFNPICPDFGAGSCIYN